MGLSTMLLTNESITKALQSSGLRRVNIRSSLEDAMLLSNSDDEGTQAVNLAMNLTSPIKYSSSFVFASFAQAFHANQLSPYKAWHMSNAKNHTHSTKPLVYPPLTTTNVHILDALKITMCCRRSVSDITKIDFDNIVIENVKYMPSMFNGDVIFVFSIYKSGSS